MPRRLVLTASERESLFALPENQDDLIRYYTFNAHDLSIIRLHREDVNRLGFAIQLCYMRYPGIILGFAERPFGPLLNMVARQLNIGADHGKHMAGVNKHVGNILLNYNPFLVFYRLVYPITAKLLKFWMRLPEEPIKV